MSPLPSPQDPRRTQTGIRHRWTSPAAVLHAERIEPALASREWVIAGKDTRAHAFLILSRRGSTSVNGEAVELLAPGLLWLPSRSDQVIRFEAGARGYMLSAEDDFVARTISGAAEGVRLRRAVGRLGYAHAQQLRDYAAELTTSFEALARESLSPDRGSLGILAAHLTLICLHVWRLSPESLHEESGLRGTGTFVLRRFLQLVELHYREHWSVRRYADALQVTEDRLHTVCTRHADKPPSALIQDRLVTEACNWLQRTGLPVEQVAFAMGFRDPSYFSRFCRKHLGIPPGEYRRQTRRRSGSESSFAAWP